jgi:uncharacterized membrane protein (DUF106 family)
MPTFGPILGTYFGLVLEPTIGFNGEFPVLTLFFAGLIVVTLSSLLTNFFTDWKAVGRAQEISRAFQKELSKARREGNTNRINKLMKMQPEIMRMTTQSSSGMMKPMVFLIIFIWPIFMWLRVFLSDLSYYYFTVPWANHVSLFSRPFLWQAWLWLYLIFSMILGQLVRQGLKLISWSNWWQNIKRNIKPV